MNYELKSPAVLLVNGEYPTHPAPLGILRSANTIICTDGSANLLDQSNQKSQVIIKVFNQLQETLNICNI